MKKEEIVELQTDAMGVNHELGELLEEARSRQTKYKRLHEYYFELCDEICDVRRGLLAVNPNLFKLATLLERFGEEDDE